MHAWRARMARTRTALVNDTKPDVNTCQRQDERRLLGSNCRQTKAGRAQPDHQLTGKWSGVISDGLAAKLFSSSLRVSGSGLKDPNQLNTVPFSKRDKMLQKSWSKSTARVRFVLSGLL